jgi:cephalosporin hydroxylase
MAVDDREAFAHRGREQAEALGRDAAAFRRSLDTVLDLDRYDYTYLWTWMGAPIIQMPADVMATQEAIWATRPDVIVETGVARGGSVIFMASLLKLMGEGFVIGIDIDIRAHNRDTIERHPMADRIRLVEGSSVDPATVARVRSMIPPGARVMVVLDSNHARDHVLAECRAYGPLVTPGCYLVVADTLVAHVAPDHPSRHRARSLGPGDEPLAARDLFLAETDAFEVDPVINGKLVLSSSPGGYLRRRG